VDILRQELAAVLVEAVALREITHLRLVVLALLVKDTQVVKALTSPVNGKAQAEVEALAR
jgi:pyrimidine deaminase RibD-like protein